MQAFHHQGKDNMNTKLHAAAAAMLLFTASAALAQEHTLQRNVNQQSRIQQGLESGALTTREAAKLEAAESRIERNQARAMSDGVVTPAEAARLHHQQNHLSREIYREKHDAQTGDPDSASSRRMQADVQRNVHQQSRIVEGVRSGELTTREAARLEAGQARNNAMQARAGADGHVGPHEQRRIQRAENRESRRIYRQKHNAQRK